MIITNCPRCGAMNATATCTKCGWSQFNKSTVSTRITSEIELKVSGKALLDDYKRLLLENRNLKERIAELEEQNDRLQDAWFKDETICPDGSLKPKVSTLLSRIAELSQAVGLITTLKPTMVMDTEHPLDMAKEVVEYVTVRIAELEADNAEFRQLIRDWSIVLEQNDEFQLWQVESVRQAMLEINKEREE